MRQPLVTDLIAAVKKIAPDWTNHQDADPGITLFELFAWLSDNLLYRVGPDSDKKADLLNRIIARLVALGPDACTASQLTRPSYYFGKLLTASDFEDEQNYTRNMMKLHNRCLFGAGIVTGLGVTVDSSASEKDAPVITVAPGCAIAPDGQLSTVCEPLRCALHATAVAGFVVLQYCERAIDPAPVFDGPPQYSRIEEGVALSLEEAPLTQGIAIARLKRKAARWAPDRRLHPPKLQHP